MLNTLCHIVVSHSCELLYTLLQGYVFHFLQVCDLWEVYGEAILILIIYRYVLYNISFCADMNDIYFKL